MNRSVEVALLIDTENTWGRRIIAGIANAIRGNLPWRMIIAPRDQQWRLRVPEGWKGHGLITSIRDQDTAEHVRQLGLPVVNVSSWGRDLPWAAKVMTDDFARARLAYEHLRAKGYQRFAFYVPAGQPHLHHRGQEFRELVQSQGFPCDDYSHWLAPSRGQPPQPLEWLTRLQFPVAILAANPHPAIQLSELCREAGIRVPNEVAILSSDTDDLICEIADPPISSIELACEQLGAQAAQQLARLIEGEPAPSEPTLIKPIGVIERHSTATLAIGDPLFADAVKYLRENAHLGIHVADVLQAVPISRRMLEQQFASLLGISPAAEIRRIRIEYVKTLLTTTDQSLQQIANQAGFRSTTRLGELFRIEVGTTPKEYRRMFFKHAH